MSQLQYDSQTPNKFEKRADTQIINDNSGEFSAGDFPFYPPHALTGVDKLHTQGFFGKGVIVGVIDTGVDYNHPALGGCFGQGCKIGGGTDLVGDAYNGTNNPQPGTSPSCLH
jgi:subtilisin family serine protease